MTSADTFASTIAHVREELRGIRSGRAAPGLVEDIVVEHYGTTMPLKQLASVTVPDPRTLAVTPWDKTAVPAVAKALEQADLGSMPQIAGEVIRVTLPSMSQERREQLVRLVGKIVEEGRISIRRARDEIIDELRERQRTGEMSEDAFFKEKARVEDAVKEANAELEKLRQQKEEELMSV